MAKRSKHGPELPVTPEVEAWLSANGKRGGATTRRLIELGKQAAEESGEDIKEEIVQKLRPQSKARRAA